MIRGRGTGSQHSLVAADTPTTSPGPPVSPSSMTAPAAGASGGLRDAMSCEVCAELYEQTVRTPLFLPCGHTFCRSCLTDLKKTGRFHCPTCRAGHNNLQVEALKVNYSLLNILPLCNRFESGTCTTHGDDLRYWCANCGLSLCSICLYSGHPQGHTVKLAQTFVKEQKEELEEGMNIVFKNLEQRKKALKNGFNDVGVQVAQLLSQNVDLHKVEVAARNLLGDIRKANDIASVLSYKQVVEEFQLKKELSEHDEEKGAKKAHASGNALERMSLVAEDKDLQLGLNIAFEKKATTTSGVSKPSMREAPCSVMDYRDGRLLLHTTRLFLQVPREVFLELGVGDRCLGRVYIRLWCHLRRAQQLLALCMGTMGPSLLGAKASDKVRSIIEFHSAVDRDKQTVSRALLTGLEWGGQHVKPEAEGLVTGMTSYDRRVFETANGLCSYNMHGYRHGGRQFSNEDIAFGICTQEHPGMNVNAAFGEVFAGLEVAKEAFQHNPVSEITITSCGLVLLGLSQQG